MTGISLTDLPALNAALNGISALLLASGYLRRHCRSKQGQWRG